MGLSKSKRRPTCIRTRQTAVFMEMAFPSNKESMWHIMKQSTIALGYNMLQPMSVSSGLVGCEFVTTVVILEAANPSG